MTLRSPFKPQQLLFLALVFAGLTLPVRAQDIVQLQDGTVINGKILGMSGTAVNIQDAKGTVGRPLSQIRAIQMAAPKQWNDALKSITEHNSDAALKSLAELAAFKGLPVQWAQQMTATFGDIYIEKGDLDKAEAAYKDFQRLYPAAAQAGGPADIGLARLAVAKKDFATAKQKIEPVTAKAMEDKNPANAAAYGYSQAFLVQGEIKEAEGDFAGALENYLRTVGIFYQDRAAVAAAQEKADALRKAHPEIFIP